MKKLLARHALLAEFLLIRLSAFDYAPPILESGQDASLEFGNGERGFFYSIGVQTLGPLEQPTHRVSLAFGGEGSGRVLQFGPSRIQFSRDQEVSASSEEYRAVGGSNWIGIGSYDASPSPRGWHYNDHYQGSGLDWWRRLTEVLIGLRFQLEDGVHHGWIRFSRADTHFTTVFQPQEYDWNPIPDAAIGAGQPPIIPIATEVRDGILRLSWSPSLATWTLESTGELSEDSIWVSVPEATGSEALLDLPDASRYFRLRKP